MLNRDVTLTGRKTFLRPVSYYTRADLNAECAARGFEEFQVPLGTCRITNDLLRLQYHLKSMDGDHDSRIESLERDLQQAEQNITNLELESDR